MKKSETVPLLYTLCGCAGWTKGHPYNPALHPMPVSLGEAERLIEQAKNPPPLEEPEPAEYFLASEDALVVQEGEAT